MGLMTFAQDLIETGHLGDWSSIIGLIVSLIGFTITIINVMLSKSAAKRAELAADKALNSMKGIEVVGSLTKAISLLEEIHRLNRTNEWQVILDRHVTFRGMVTAVKVGNPVFEEEQLARLQAAIQHSASISNKIEMSLEKNEEPNGIAQMNKILSDQMQKLGELLAGIRNEVGR